MTKQTLVRLLTPLFTALAAVLTGWLARHFPGVHIPASALGSVMALGGASALVAALHWLHLEAQRLKPPKPPAAP